MTNGVTINFSELSSVEENLAHIVLYEVKSTNQAKYGADFAGYFFSLSTAELLVAQSLGNQFRFVFVNTVNPDVPPRERTLQEVFAHTRSIYPEWSIRLGPAPAPST